MYIQELSRLKAVYFKPEEDVHYSFVEYGGGNLTHFSFLEREDHPIEVERLCARAMLIVDSDGIESKLERKEELKKKLGENLQILAAREIENTLPINVIQDVVRHYEGTTELPVLHADNYEHEKLGLFIENWLQGNYAMARRGGYKETSGTIKDKRDFCSRAVDLLEYVEFTQLPAATQELTRNIYKFITNKNRGDGEIDQLNRN